jgi:hypothetical protein
MLLVNFRTAIGDIQLSKYDKWLEKDENQNVIEQSNLATTAQFIIWFFWILNIYINNIIMLNLLIAQVS